MRGYTVPVSSLSSSDFEPLVRIALQEDSPEGDITSLALFSKNDLGEARLVSREEGILCGSGVLEVIQREIGSKLSARFHRGDGEMFQKGEVIATLVGSYLDILRIERIFLNFLQHLSGISTTTHNLQTQYPNLKILDTRKTLPGYRKLAKYAVYIGGGYNHRISLSDMGMLKDNHIAAYGSIANAVKKFRENYPSKKIELEIDSLEQLPEAISVKPDILLLDNFSISDMKTAVHKIRDTNLHLQSPIQIEVSGGITPEKLKDLNEIGGIGVSMGYLTHTTRFLDLSLEVKVTNAN